MTEMTERPALQGKEREVVEWLGRASGAIYLAAEESVAKEISGYMLRARSLIETLAGERDEANAKGHKFATVALKNGEALLAAEARVKELTTLGRTLLNSLPAHWHDDPVTEFTDAVEEVERAALSASTPVKEAGE